MGSDAKQKSREKKKESANKYTFVSFRLALSSHNIKVSRCVRRLPLEVCELEDHAGVYTRTVHSDPFGIVHSGILIRA